MCGIIGYVGNENAVTVIMEGLKKLEYRGYDSAGIAVFGEKGFNVVKQKGRLEFLESKLRGNTLVADIGIGHTRWATHGEPSDVNSHPHISSKGEIAVVHNGIIENYKQLKERLMQKGVNFVSETDSEAIAHLAEYYYDGDLLDTIIKVSNALEGSYALGIMCLSSPDTLFAIKKDNPLIVGVSEKGNFIASDIPAILGRTNKVCYPEDKEIVVLTKHNVKFYNLDRDELQKDVAKISWNSNSAEKDGYPHFMLKEIMQQPKAIRDTIIPTITSGVNKTTLDTISAGNYNKIIITACGSAYNAGCAAKYVIERLCRISVETELASEFRYKDAIIDAATLVILVSQSGETADTIAALREAKSKGAKTLSIVNIVGSTIAKESDYTLYTLAGPEIAVATTKAFSAQLIVLYAIAVKFAADLKRLSKEEMQVLHNELLSIPEKTEQILENIDEIQKYAASCVGYKSIFFIGRNIDYAIAQEGSLKLKEISYIHSEAYAGGELKHGTISLIEDDTLVVAIACCPKLVPKIQNNTEQVISRGAKVFMVTNCEEILREDKLAYSRIPKINELFSPSLSVIVLQLFSYYVAANKGLDIDKPRNLAKSVTVE